MDPFLPWSRWQGSRALQGLPAPVRPTAAPHGLVRPTDGVEPLPQWAHGGCTVPERLSLVVVGDQFASGQGATSHILGPSLAARMADGLAREVVWQLVCEDNATIADVHGNLVNRVPSSANVVVLLVGAADVLARTAVSDWGSRLDRVLAIWSEVCRVVVCGVPNLGAAPVVPWPLSSSLSGRGRELDEVSREICGRHGRSFVPLCTAGQAGFSTDDWSPSEASQRLWADVVASAMEL